MESPYMINYKYSTATGVAVSITVLADDETTLLKRGNSLYKKIGEGMAKQNGIANGQANENWCSIHNSEMKLFEKNGGSWYSHQANGQWCKGK